MSIFTCQRCGERTTDPADHLVGHGLTPTLAAVWDFFTLHGHAKEKGTRPKTEPGGTAPLWGEPADL